MQAQLDFGFANNASFVRIMRAELDSGTP